MFRFGKITFSKYFKSKKKLIYVGKENQKSHHLKAHSEDQDLEVLRLRNLRALKELGLDRILKSDALIKGKLY